MNVIHLHELDFEVAAFSEQGPRSENQDAYATERFAETGIIALADGMGGQNGGRVAADTALQVLSASPRLRSLEDARRAARDADRSVIRTAEGDPERLGGMGCALAFLALTNGAEGTGWIAAHVGDVRILSRSPDGVLRLETKDHTPAFARWEAGEITLDEIPDSAGANRLQRAVGRAGEADVTWLPAAPGWSWLIISDGVYKAMRMDEMAAAVSAPDAEAACQALRNKVEERGADDNYTAVFIRARGGPAAFLPLLDDEQTVTSETMSEPSKHPTTFNAISLGLAVLALAVALTSLWTVRNMKRQDERIEQIGVQVDSLHLLVGDMINPFDPMTPGEASPDSSIPVAP